MLNKQLIASATLILSSLLISPQIFAQDNRETTGGQSSSTFPKPAPVREASFYSPHVGILAGYSAPEGSYQSNVEYGIDVGFQPYVPFGLGIEVTQANYDADGPGNDLTRTKALAKASYNLGGNIPVIRESYIGVGAGPMLERANGSDVVYMGLMPNLGFDIPLRNTALEKFSLGANARYLITSSNAPDVFSLNGVAKYWF
jgi:hypothetical protein